MNQRYTFLKNGMNKYLHVLNKNTNYNYKWRHYQ